MKESFEHSPSRFDLGTNEVVRDRINKIQSTVREMQQHHPEVASFLMFGSMVKGYATEKSDIDGCIVIDTDAISNPKHTVNVDIYWRPLAQEKDAPLDLTDIQPNSIGAELKPQFKSGYEKWTKAYLKENIPELEDEQMEHIKALPISFEALDLILKIWRDSLQRTMKKGVVDPEKDIQISEYLSQLFFLEIGNGSMRKYRAHIIRRLFSYGALGHSMWNKIIGFTEFMERKVNRMDKKDLAPNALETGIFTDVRYPRTLEEAKKVYG